MNKSMSYGEFQKSLLSSDDEQLREVGENDGQESFRLWLLYSAMYLKAEKDKAALVCFNCKHHGKYENEIEMGYPSPCTRCIRRSVDNWEAIS